MTERIKDIEKESREYFTHASHGFDHVSRVRDLALNIAQKEAPEYKELVEAAALLHDIARTEELNGKDVCHAKKGAEMCIPLLKKHGFSQEEIDMISDAVRTHRYKNQLAPTSKVGEIIQDADRLDILGAIGIGRVFTRAGERGSPLHDPDIAPQKIYKSGMTTAINHFYEKILKVDPGSFNTETARDIAISRYNYTRKFVEIFEKEWKGEI